MTNKYTITPQFHQKMEHECQVDRLATISKIFLDARFLKIKKENEELKKRNEELELRMFWVKHSPQKLARYMKEANNDPFIMASCNCENCFLARRLLTNTEVDYSIKECKFIAWFNQRAQDCGLTYTKVDVSFKGNYKAMTIGKKNITGYQICDVDYHMVDTSFDKCDRFVFGRKLFAAKNVNDPELKKLVRLFKIIRQYEPYDSCSDGLYDSMDDEDFLDEHQ